MVYPVCVDVADATIVWSAINSPHLKFRVFSCIIECSIVSHMLIPCSVEVIGHDVDVVQVLSDIKGLHATQQVARSGCRDGQHIVNAVLNRSLIKLLTKDFHQFLVRCP